MKDPSQPTQAQSPKEDSTVNESDEETCGDRLVIDLDSSMSTTDNKSQAKAASSPEAVDSDGPSSKTKESSKVGRSDSAPPGKPKGKRNGQKKGSENNKADSSASNKVTGKAAKAEKEKTTAGKPGRKKKEKQSPTTVKTEATEQSVDDPFKFEVCDEKIAGTATGKSDGKSKSNKPCRDAQTEYDWRSVAIVTEPENLGPCEPGTQVCLEGIVWQETNNGVLVVNVTWKGKTYMGTLLDATKHDWSPPSCDSPTGDFEGRTPKGRGKRSRVPLSDTFKDINERKLRKEMRKQSGHNQARPKSPVSPKSENGKRKGRSSEGDTSEPTTKRGRGNNSHSPPALIECPEPNCSKKYKQMNGLKYHQRNAHHDSSPQVPSDTTSEEPEKSESVSSPESSAKSKLVNGSNEEATAQVTHVKSSSPVRNNTTSVITPTTNNVTNTTTPPSANVPVATITPQVVKPATSSEEPGEQSPNSSHQLTSSSSRTVPISAPPKLISKPTINNSAMAPISTITSPGTFNPSLKPIQPKPTILGDLTPHPGLHELMDQKKLKRKRSLSKDDLPATYNHMEPQKAPAPGMHKFDTEHRGLLSTGGMINAAPDPSTLLQSPSYSDISDDGELKSAAARRELLSGGIHPQNLYQPVATVSPQKNAPLPDKDKKTFNRHTPSHSPIPGRMHDDKHKQQMQYFSAQAHSWTPDLMHMSNKEKSDRPTSPKLGSYNKPSSLSQSKDVDPRVSSDRLQILKDSMDLKGTQSSRHDTPRDYTVSPNTSTNSNDLVLYHEQKQREAELEHHNKLMKALSPAKLQSSQANRPIERFEKTSRSSPMPPPSSLMPPFGTFLHQQLMQQMTANPMLARLPPGFPGFPYPHLASMAVDSKDARNSTSPSFSGNSKPNHKIHELEGIQSSKSPRPTSNDRQMPSKNQPITSQAALQSAAAAMLSPYNPAVLHQSLAGMFPPSK